MIPVLIAAIAIIFISAVIKAYNFLKPIADWLDDMRKEDEAEEQGSLPGIKMEDVIKVKPIMRKEIL